jgi:hypothetical protein
MFHSFDGPCAWHDSRWNGRVVAGLTYALREGASTLFHGSNERGRWIWRVEHRRCVRTLIVGEKLHHILLLTFATANEFVNGHQN